MRRWPTRTPALLREHGWLLAVLGTLVSVLVLLDWLADEPVRRWVEREANGRLIGYTVHIGHLDVRPWLLAGALYELTIRQDAHPDPPVADVAVMSVDLDWRAALAGRLVGEASVAEPVVHVDTTQLREEWNDRTPFGKRGWQRLWQLYPLRMNRLTVTDGRLVYVDESSGRSLHLDRLFIQAANIRHVTAKGKTYPSPFEMRARVFKRGRLVMEGHADFLLRPHGGMNVVAELDGLPLAALGPIVDDYRIHLSDGVVSGRGQLEVAPDKYIANMQAFKVENLRLDYVAAAETPAIDALKRQARMATRYADRSPALRFRARTMFVGGTFGYVSDTAQPYRVFIDRAAVRLTNFSNRAWQGESRLVMSGRFMGSGDTTVRGILRPGRGPTDMALDAKVIGTNLVTLNDLLRAHGRLDVSEGQLSVFCQVQVHDGRIRGYIKPLFRDVEVYDPRDDRGENVFQHLYEAIVEQLAKVLANRPRQEVATIVDVSGPLKDPDISTLQVIGNLLRNAFVEAILPGFDAERSRAAVRSHNAERPARRREAARLPPRSAPEAAPHARLVDAQKRSNE